VFLSMYSTLTLPPVLRIHTVSGATWVLMYEPAWSSMTLQNSEGAYGVRPTNSSDALMKPTTAVRVASLRSSSPVH
jgi:hypothetical protein